jgi:geranylgeranyl pyrophosphate synthase
MDEQAERIGAFSALYLLAADLLDDVQDEDLAGKPHEAAGPAIALNNGIALLLLGLQELCRGMELESDPERARCFLTLFNQTSLAAVSGQHRDLIGEDGAKTPREVLEMQRDKTSSLWLLTECGALLGGCGPGLREQYRLIGENLAMLVQVRDDLRDIYGKEVSPDLLTGRITYPLSRFLETADPALIERYEALLGGLPETMEEIRRLVYDSKVVERSAVALQGFREEIHRTVAATGNESAYHRTFLDLVDQLAESVYTPPPVQETQHLWDHSKGAWHERVRQSRETFLDHMRPFGVPDPPRLRPWHLPQWLYDAERKTIFYPDVEGLKEEILPFQASLLGTPDLNRAAEVMEMQAPVVLAHEMFHFWRHAASRLTGDHWHEEWAANRLAVAYALRFFKDVAAASLELATDVVARFKDVIDDGVGEILERCKRPTREKGGYGMEMHRIAVVTLEMVRRIAEEGPDLDTEVADLLRPQET